MSRSNGTGESEMARVGGAVRRALNAVGWGFLMRRRAALSAAVLTLGLALGANTVVFSVLRGFLQSSFGAPAADRLFVVAPTRDMPGRGSVIFAEAFPNYLLLRETTRSYEALAVTVQSIASWSDGTSVRALQASRVSASFFATMRVQPTLGRAFTEVEEGPSPAAVVVIGYDVWREHFAASPAVLGSVMSLDGVPHTVIGVMPPGFALPLPTEIWLPFDIPEQQRRNILGARTLGVYGRLAEGVSREEAVRELVEIDRRALEASADNTGFRYDLRTVLQLMLPKADRTVLLVQIGAAVLVLLAVLNLSTVLVAWGFERRREMSVRIALGAEKRGVVRLLVIQNLLVACLGAALGLTLAALSLPWLRSMDVGRALGFFMRDLKLDVRVLAVSAVTAIAAALLAGLVPAWLAARGDVGDSLRSGGRLSSLSPAAVKWQKGMVLAQVTLTVVLGCAAAFVGLSLRNLSAVDPGFRTGGKVVARVQMPGADYAAHDARAAFADRLLAALGRERALAAFGFTSTLPVGDVPFGARFFTDPAQAATEEPMLLHIRRVSPGYHEVAGIPLLSGRAFQPSDDAGGPKVAILSHAIAERLWPGEDAVGKPIFRVVSGNPQPERLEVVGVAGDVIDAGAASPPGETVYVPYAQISNARLSIVVDPREDVPAAVAAVRRALHEADPELAVDDVATLESLLRPSNALPRLQTILLVGFGLIATWIVALGCYGVMSQLVATRRAEMAVRLVFGATPKRLGGSVLAQAAAIALPGIALGALLVKLLGRALEPFVFGIGTGSPGVLAGVCGVTFGVIALASLSPALSVMRQDVKKGIL
jgi:putative ABC transport system permease protein